MPTTLRKLSIFALTAVSAGLLGGCGVLPPGDFCTTTQRAIVLANQKGRICLAETSFDSERFDAAGCAAQVPVACSTADQLRIEQWASCWDEVAACSNVHRMDFVRSGNACATDAALAEVSSSCLTLFGDTSRR